MLDARITEMCGIIEGEKFNINQLRAPLVNEQPP
jgi:hypothetical protein